jgi:PAS domain-containing protein
MAVEVGVCVFDGNLRLVAWNKRFKEIFGIPDDLLVLHRPYEEMVQYSAHAGLYPSIKIRDI